MRRCNDGGFLVFRWSNVNRLVSAQLVHFGLWTGERLRLPPRGYEYYGLKVRAIVKNVQVSEAPVSGCTTSELAPKLQQ